MFERLNATVTTVYYVRNKLLSTRSFVYAVVFLTQENYNIKSFYVQLVFKISKVRNFEPFETGFIQNFLLAFVFC